MLYSFPPTVVPDIAHQPQPKRSSSDSRVEDIAHPNGVLSSFFALSRLECDYQSHDKRTATDHFASFRDSEESSIGNRDPLVGSRFVSEGVIHLIGSIHQNHAAGNRSDVTQILVDSGIPMILESLWTRGLDSAIDNMISHKPPILILNEPTASLERLPVLKVFLGAWSG